MNRRWLPVVAVATASAFVILAAALYVLARGGGRLSFADFVAWASGAMSYAIVGVIVALRRPANAIGWLFLLIGLSGTSGLLGVAYAGYGLASNAAGAPLGAWYASIETAIGTGLIGVVFVLLFPNGRLPSRRWVPVLVAGIVGMAGTAIGFGFAPGPLVSFPLENPFGVTVLASTVALIGSVGLALQVVTTLAAIGSQFMRFARAGRDERQQLKWMAAAAILFLIVAGVGALAGVTARSGFGTAVGSLALEGFPVAAGIAILRHRLYDLDLLINRTVVYGATTAAIAIGFFVGLVVLQTLLRSFTGGSDLAIAASTLVSFALFQPIRRRVQDAVDRRFDRSRYDAARTLDAFADRVRDEVDLDALRADLLGAVYETMAPAHTSLWLRERAR